MVWVNFLPWRRRRQCRQLRRDGLLIAALLAIFLATALPLAQQQALSERQQLRVQWRQETNKQLDRLKARLGRLEQQRDTLRRELAISVGRQERLRAWYAFTQELAGTMPAALWLREINKSTEELTITGFCLQLADLEAFRQRLQRLAPLQQVKTGRLSRDEKKIIHFSLFATLAALEGEHE
ncbi:PilN domain-containing protein [Kalamiella sp. sgz302252]|uniref:PilN domain-containing protein n=1 Tax=Pantoea sp. sgz302252 TaxID=3341827 RepID=UPI0036D2C499